MLAFGVAGCDTLMPSRSPSQTPVAAAAPPADKQHGKKPHDIALDPGCPLGSEAVLGLNLAEKRCNSSARTHPAGPVGIPNAN
ncbi:MAG: hypothetical protein ACREFC_01280 [Stellaceae bacterium]